jgi:hypothetical protein
MPSGRLAGVFPPLSALELGNPAIGGKTMVRGTYF